MPQHQNTWLLKHGATIHEVAAQGYDTVNKWTHVLRTACAALGTRLCMSSMNRMILRGLSATSLHTAFKRSCGVGRGNSSRQGRDQHTSKGATTGYICGLPKHSCQPPHCTQPSSAPAGGAQQHVLGRSSTAQLLASNCYKCHPSNPDSQQPQCTRSCGA
jgi:hypothetical protein